jgi:hypothetical protein
VLGSINYHQGRLDSTGVSTTRKVKSIFSQEMAMAEKEKHICKWDKDRIEDKLDQLMKIVKAPGYVCRRCGRAAGDKKWLCKPVALK